MNSGVGKLGVNEKEACELSPAPLRVFGAPSAPVIPCRDASQQGSTLLHRAN
jgi:hypothetical protein